MRLKINYFAVYIISAFIMSGTAVIFAQTNAEQNFTKMLQGIEKYEFGDSRVALSKIADLVQETKDPAQRAHMAESLAMILSKKSTVACKQFICEQLRIIGTAKLVPQLIALLGDEKLTDIALFALENIAVPEVDRSLRERLPKAEGKTRLAIIHTLGNRRDAQSVNILSRLIQDCDNECRAAAALALGKIGDLNAAAALWKQLQQEEGAWRRIFANAYLDCAQNQLESGDKVAAKKLFQNMIGAEEYSSIRTRARAGLAALDEKSMLQFVKEALKSESTQAHNYASRLVREAMEPDMTLKFCAYLPELPEQGQIILLAALADRGDAKALAAMVKASEFPNEAVRIAALQAIGIIGHVEQVQLLAARSGQTTGKEQEASQQSLSTLRAKNVDAKIVELLGKTDEPAQIALINSVASRRVTDAADALINKLNEPDSEVRLVSWRAIQTICTEKHLTQLVANWSEITLDTEMEAAENAVVMISRNVDASDKPASPILKQLDVIAATKVKFSMIKALGRIGDTNSLPWLRAAIKNKDANIKDAAIRSLSSWPTAEPIEDIKYLAANAQDQYHRILALRGYIRMLGLPSEREEKTSVEFYRQALNMASRFEEKRLILSGLGDIIAMEALKAVEPFLEDPELQNEAAAAAVNISSELEDSVETTHIKRTLQKVIDISKNDSEVREEAQEIIRRLK